jgi:hypothetical protein
MAAFYLVWIRMAISAQFVDRVAGGAAGAGAAGAGVAPGAPC